ncbi:exodeoxyribonuclease VII large subunit [Candidatus Saccharibacteria bacterium]|nr:exodeoxyribonuclease VII large subunit [Candidatus Saccharibacteria bacterium]
MEKIPLRLQVSELIALTNQTLEYAYPSIEVEGEVASFKVNQGKFVFFDLKDETGSVACFMTVWQLRMPVEDGMKIVVTATPKLTNWGKFSLTIQTLRPSGEGSLKKSFELLKARLEKEGMFATERKRSLPRIPSHIGVISSTQAAGYADFIKIINDRFGGISIDVAHVQVQGATAADQIINAIRYFNTTENMPEVLVVLRGGGSAEDLSAFNDEQLVREIASSRIPVLTGIGHEIDESLADLAADVRAATPSNAAQLLVPDRREIIATIQHQVRSIIPAMEHQITRCHDTVAMQLENVWGTIQLGLDTFDVEVQNTRRLLAEFDPQKVLARGYALVRGTVGVGQDIMIERAKDVITAEVKNVSKK